MIKETCTRVSALVRSVVGRAVGCEMCGVGCEVTQQWSGGVRIRVYSFVLFGKPVRATRAGSSGAMEVTPNFLC